MSVTDMQAHLDSIDQRLARVEQILPTLATKEQLERLRVRSEALNEGVRDDIRLVAESVASFTVQVGALTTQVGSLTAQVGSLTTQVGAMTTQVGALTTQFGSLTDQLQRRGAV